MQLKNFNFPSILFKKVLRRSKIALFFAIFYQFFMMLLISAFQKFYEIGPFTSNESPSHSWHIVMTYIACLESFASNAFLLFICFLILEIRVRFAALNEALKMEILKDFSWIFMQLCEAAEIINVIFAHPVMLFITSHHMFTTFQLYDLYALLKSPNVQIQQIGYSVSTNMYSFFVNSFIIMFIVCCSLTLMEARKSMETLQRRLQKEHFKNCSKKGEKDKKILKFFILQLKHIQPKFSCDFYDFNWVSILLVRKFLD